MILPNRIVIIHMTVAEAAQIVKFIMKANLRDKILGSKEDQVELFRPLTPMFTDEEFQVILGTAKEEMRELAEEKNLSTLN